MAAGPEPVRLVCHGRVIASAFIMPTEDQLERLRRSCPDAAGVGVVAGDPCYDRLAASLPARDAYRHALGADDRKLVAVSSTWGPGSVLSRCPGLLRTLVDELPADDYQIAAIVYPGIWSWHGARQVCAWYADCVERGPLLVPPEEGWRGGAWSRPTSTWSVPATTSCYADSNGPSGSTGSPSPSVATSGFSSPSSATGQVGGITRPCRLATRTNRGQNDCAYPATTTTIPPSRSTGGAPTPLPDSRGQAPAYLPRMGSRGARRRRPPLPMGDETDISAVNCADSWSDHPLITYEA